MAEIRAIAARIGRPFVPHIPAYGSLSVTVPGAVDAWFALHEKFGRLPMAENLAPAIAYARDGFPVSQLVAQSWRHNMAAFARDWR